MVCIFWEKNGVRWRQEEGPPTFTIAVLGNKRVELKEQKGKPAGSSKAMPGTPGQSLRGLRV
jgi:hypothetical protein